MRDPTSSLNLQDRPINSEIVYENGSFQRVREWYRGWKPELAKNEKGEYNNLSVKLIFGHTGRETEVTREIVKAANMYFVMPEEAYELVTVERAA